MYKVITKRTTGFLWSLFTLATSLGNIVIAEESIVGEPITDKHSNIVIAMNDDPFMQNFEESSVPIVLTTTRLKQPQAEVPASVTIIDREMIEMIGARELPELLRLVPGMSIGNVDGNIPTVSYHATVSVDIKRMQVMIDGRSVYQPGLARVLWDDMPITVDDIERIEVTRGPNAAAYGPNSFSAIINIITRHPEDTQWAKGRINQGNNGIQDYYVRGGAAFDDISFRVTAYGRSDDGYDKNKVGQDRNDKKDIQGFNTRSVYNMNNHTAELNLGYNETDREIDSMNEWQNFGTFEETPKINSENYYGMFKWRTDFNDTHSVELQLYSHQVDQKMDWRSCMYSADAGMESNLIFTREAFLLREYYRSMLVTDPRRDRTSYRNAGNMAVLAEAVVEGVIAAGLPTDLTTLQAVTANELKRSVVDQPFSPEEDALLIRARDIALANEGQIPLLCGEVDNAIDESRIDIELVDNLIIGESLRLVTGLAYREEKSDSRYYLNGKEKNEAYRLFAHLEYRPVDFMVANIGGHYENDTISDADFSPRVALNFLFGEQQSIRLVYSEASRSVDIYEAYASPRLYMTNLNQPYASDTQGMLGQQQAIFYMQEDMNVKMISEKIESREIGYYGYFSSLFEVDVRIFREELSDLFSDALNLTDFDPNNHSKAIIDGVETQIKWRITKNDLFMLVAAYIDNQPSTKTEARFSSKRSGSAMYNHAFDFGLNMNLAFHQADDYDDMAGDNKSDGDGINFKRLDVGVSQMVRLDNLVLKLSGKLMHRIDDNVFVNANNIYDDRNIYYITAEMQF